MSTMKRDPDLKSKDSLSLLFLAIILGPILLILVGLGIFKDSPFDNIHKH